MKKILFFDIDGTLATREGVLPNNKLALQRLRDAGHIVIIASGRPSWYVENMFGSLVDGYVCSNGRYISYKQEVVLDKPLTQIEIETVISACNLAQCGYCFVGHTQAYAGNENYILDRHLKDTFKDMYTNTWDVKDVHAYMFDLYYQDANHLESIKKVMDETFITNDHHEGSADMSTRSFTKGHAVAYLTKHLGLDVEDSYAFGDGDNDIEMFKYVGTAIAMGNAVENAKKVANYITANIEEDGIYKALQHFELLK